MRSTVPWPLSASPSALNSRYLRDELPALRISRCIVSLLRALRQGAGNVRHHQARTFEAQMIFVKIQGLAIAGQQAAAGDRGIAQKRRGPDAQQRGMVGQRIQNLVGRPVARFEYPVVGGELRRRGL